MDLNAAFKNIVRIRTRDAQGRVLSDFRVKNSMTFAWAGIVMNAIARSGPSQVGWLYARFGDSGANPGTLSPTNNDLRYTVRNTFLTSADGVRGGLWVPLLSAPQQSTSDPSLYNNNQLNFGFRIPGNISANQVSPANNFNPASSYIYALGLAVSANVTDRTQDIIITALQNFPPFPVPSDGQVVVDYPLLMQVLPPS